MKNNQCNLIEIFKEGGTHIVAEIKRSYNYRLILYIILPIMLEWITYHRSELRSSESINF